MNIQPQQLHKLGNKQFKITWSDGHESIYEFRYLRQNCQCALCVDEWSGKPLLARESVSKDLEGLKADIVGQYALRIDFSDGHSTGIYTFKYLRELCPCAQCLKEKPFDVKDLLFDSTEWQKFKSACEQGYPREVCGLLFGDPGFPTLKVKQIAVLENVLDPKHSERLKQLVENNLVTLPKERMGRGGAFEFMIDPQEHYKKILEAQKQGLDQIGIFHSHPDHSAVPSTIDASQPMLAGWSSVIVAVKQGKFDHARSWFRISESDAFQEQNILVE